MSSIENRALILAPFTHYHIQRLADRCDLTYESWIDTHRIHAPEELATRIEAEGITILVVESDFVFDEVFDHAPTLQLVGICRAALNHVDIEAATRHGVAVVNTPGRNAQAVAELALALMFALARRVPKAHQYLTEGLWENPIEPYVSLRGIELSGRMLGIVGLGNIGRRLACMALAIGMHVVAYDPYVSEPNVSEPSQDVALTSLDAVMWRSDFVSVHVPNKPETLGMITAHHVDSMKPNAFIVNLSDSAIVDQPALVAALREHQIAGAALDVFDTHPIAPDSPYLRLDNVILTPHIGGATEETIDRHSKMMADDILLFLDGERPINLVNPEVWHRAQ